ncbi:MAG: MFS transporter [Actinomycetota bacterium]|nr:MFS transporter [Actinomycetota bacterium]
MSLGDAQRQPEALSPSAAEAATVVPLRQNRDFVRLWGGGAVSALGTSTSSLVFPLIGYAITGSAAQAGLATTALLLGSVLAQLPAGALVDHWPRGRVLVLTNLVGAVSYASLAVAALANRLTLAHLVAVGLLSGISAAFFGPAASAALRTVVPEPQLAVAYSRNQARRHAADLVGPPLGGALYAVARGLPFLVDAVSYAVAALTFSRIRTPLPPPAGPEQRRRVAGDVAEGLRFVWRQPVIRAILLWGATLNFSMTFVLLTVTLRLVRVGVHPSVIGLVDTIAATAGLLGALAAPAIIARMRTGLTTIGTGLALAVLGLPIAWTDDVVVIGALLSGGFLLMPANNSGIFAYLAAVTPDRLQGRVYSATGFVANALEPAAPVLAGVLVGSIGGRAASIAGAVLTAASLVPLLTSGAVRNLGRPDDWKARPAEGSEATP